MIVAFEDLTPQLYAFVHWFLKAGIKSNFFCTLEHLLTSIQRKNQDIATSED
jgi:hypothetical protein